MKKFSRRHGFGLALGLVLALVAQTSYAGSVTIDLTVSNGSDTSNFVITLGSGFDAPGSDANNLFADLGVVNSLLAANNLGNVHFTSLGASSNNPGDSVSAFIAQNGQVNLDPGSGSVTITAVAYQTDFTAPTGAEGKLQNSSSSTFANTAAGDSQTFQSFFDQTNTGALGTPSPTLSFNYGNLANSTLSQSDTSPITNVGPITSPYAIVSQLTLTLTAEPGQRATVSYGGSSIITAAIPEPASAVMMVSALPIAFGLLRRYRRVVKSVG